jgi:hypothetical protein
VPAEAVRHPRNATEGAVPRVAVIEVAYEHMESVLTPLGQAREAIDFIRVEETPAFLRDATRLPQYDIIFLNCGTPAASGGLDDPYAPYYGPGFEPGGREGLGVIREPAVIENLRAYLRGGGRLYATDQAYDVVESIAPQAIDFAEGGADLAIAETMDQAEIGLVGADVSAVVDDVDLRNWLAATGALTPASTIPVIGFIGGWAVIDNVDPGVAKVWVRGDALVYGAATPEGQTRNVPLTVTYDAGCGRVLFSSYHTHEAIGAADADPWAAPTPLGDGPGFVTGTGPLNAQEQALAYLVLEIGACVEQPSTTLI